MGGSSKKVTVGYRYYMGLHFGICYGPVDAFLRLSTGGRAAWAGQLTSSGEINVTAPQLFGGDEREGGLVGAADVDFGGPAQTANSYLSGKIGGVIPAFRGILSFIWKGGQVSANNPYIKPFEFRVRRIKAGWENGCWYEAKAEVPISAVEPMESGSPPSTPANLTPYYVTYDQNNYSLPGSEFTNFTIYDLWDPQNPIHFTGMNTTDRLSITVTSAYIHAQSPPYPQELWAVRYFVLRGTKELASVRPVNQFNEYNSNAQAVAGLEANPMVFTGYSQYWFYIGYNAPPAPSGALQGYYTRERLVTPNPITHYGMNPAHIIYQCLTDPQWGMGYPTAQIDAANFAIAADLFYAEGLGLCMVWNQQSSIEDFVKLVLDHAGAILAVDPSTGQFILTPIRGGYDSNTLPVYDESNVIALESWQRVGYGDTVNEITVVYRDFVTNKDASVTVQDLANVQAQGAIVSQSRQYPGLPTQSLAARVAQRDLVAAATPLAKGRMTVNRAGWTRIPGDVIKLTWPKLGLSSVICRVLAVDTGTLEDGTISVEIAEDVFGLPASSYVAQESAGWEEPNTAPQYIANWEAIEAPYWDIARSISAADLAYLTDTSAYLYAVAARPGDASLQYAVYTSAGAGLAQQQNGNYVPTGSLSAQLAINGSSITLSDGVDLSSVEAGDLALIGTGQSAEWVEILTTSSPTFTIARGCLDTTPSQHAAGTQVFIPAGAYGVDETEYATAQSVSIQLADIATGGQWTGPSFDLRVVTMGGRFGRPYPPGNVGINGQAYPTIISAASLTASWAHRDRTQQTAYVVHQDEANIGPEAGTTYTVRWYKPETTLVQTNSGISGTTSPAYTPAASGPMKVEITAVRGGLESWQAQSRSFTYSRIVSGSGALASGAAAIAGTGNRGVASITGSGAGSSQAATLNGQGGVGVINLLMHMDGSNGSTTFIDEMSHATTANGNAQISTAQSQFGGASGSFDGTGDYVDVTGGADFDLGTITSSTELTVEFWVRMNVLAGNQTVCLHARPGSGGNGIGGWRVWLISGKVQVNLSKNSAAVNPWYFSMETNSVAVSTTEWRHVAVVLKAGFPYIYVDGALQASTINTSSAVYASTPVGFDTTRTNYGLRIGATTTDSTSPNPQEFLNGYIDELKITRAALYSGNFTPTGPFSI